MILEIPNPFHYTQKDNVNLDGSPNMIKNASWGRFNQCFIAANSATTNQNIFTFDSLGFKRNTNGYVDEKAYLIALTDDIVKGDWANLQKYMNVIQKERFFWARHESLMNQFFSAYEKKISYRTSLLGTDWSPIIRALSEGFQVTISLNQREINGSEGHIVGVSGGEFINKMPVWLRIEDPAGDLSKIDGYKNDRYTGKSVIYNRNIITKVFKPGQSHFMELTYEKNS